MVIDVGGFDFSSLVNDFFLSICMIDFFVPGHTEGYDYVSEFDFSVNRE